MSKPKTQPLTGQILEDATTWFVEFNEGEVDQIDREAFIEWLKTSPEHIRAYLQVTAHWEDARALPKASVPSIDDLIALAREPTNANVIPIGGSRPIEGRQERGPMGDTAHDVQASPARTPRFRRYFLAACIVFAMCGANTLYWLEFQRGVYTTDIGEQRTIRLGDGSTVELNARSKIRVALHQRERDVELIEGQALFQVAKDHARPFVVRSGGTHVLAVGTQFDVYKHRNGTTVTVVEGRVAVFPSTLPNAGEGPDLKVLTHSIASSETAPQSTRRAASVKSGAQDSGPDEIFLAAGEQLTVSSASVRMAENADVAAATAWTQRHIVFNSTPLSEVVEEFNRYNTRQLVITDSKIAGTKISGEFSSANPDSLLKGLDALKIFNIHEKAGKIEISSK